MEKSFYTSEEVMELFGRSRATFYREVEAGIIPSELAPGRKRGRKFPKEAIDALVKVIKQGEKEKLTFESSTNADIWMGFQNTRITYGEENIVSFMRLLEWKRINNDIFMSVKEKGERVGGVTFLPLAESTIHMLIEGKIRERNIPNWAVRRWTDQQLSVYIPNISVTLSGNPNTDAERGMFLIKYAIRWAISLNKEYDIKNWYGIAATDMGEKLLQHLGFKLIEEKEKAYVLEGREMSTGLIGDFLKRVEEQDNDLPPFNK
ncbi:MAG: helix-turn-helix domain-containing protein [Ktedonobacteraceae bacterium]